MRNHPETPLEYGPRRNVSPYEKFKQMIEELPGDNPLDDFGTFFRRIRSDEFTLGPRPLGPTHQLHWTTHGREYTLLIIISGIYENEFPIQIKLRQVGEVYDEQKPPIEIWVSGGRDATDDIKGVKLAEILRNILDKYPPYFEAIRRMREAETKLQEPQKS